MSRLPTLRSPQHSIFQSLVEEVAARLDRRRSGDAALGDRPDHGHLAVAVAHEVARRHHAGEPIPDEAPEHLVETHGGFVKSLGPEIWSGCKLAAECVNSRFKGRDQEARAKLEELKFGTFDAAWVATLTDYEKYFGPSGHRAEIPYVRHASMDDFVLDPLPENAKIALLGDWGTGTRTAVDVLKAVKAHRPDVLIHLGDIYYSGTERETEAYFLDIVNHVLERDQNPIPVYTLTGNHDMYSGGQGYYSLLTKLHPEPLFRPGHVQQASYFCLRSPSGAWQLLGLDTGLHDHDPFSVAGHVTYLEPDEEAWHADKIRRFSRDGGRTVLLSHHQLFSAFSRIGDPGEKSPGEEAANPKLLESFRHFQAAAADGTGDIAAWFWGHEHNLEIYEPYLGLEKGRCMGHGAIPKLLTQSVYQIAAGVPDPPRLVDDPRRPGTPLRLDAVDQVYAHGFTMIDIDDAARTATASYYQETDYQTPMYVEKL